MDSKRVFDEQKCLDILTCDEPRFERKVFNSRDGVRTVNVCGHCGKVVFKPEKVQQAQK